MKSIYLSGKKFEYDKLGDLSDEFKKRNIILGNGCELGDRCKLGYDCKLGYGCKLGDRCKLGDSCELGGGCKLGDGCELLQTPFYALGLYRYHVSAHYNNSVPYIELGCFLRTQDEWENDFWNNGKEFPNDNSDASKARIYAYNVAKDWLNFNQQK